MTTGVFLLSPGGMFADANARAVHSNAAITTSGTTVLTGFGNQELHLLINVTVAPTGVAPTLQFTVQEIDPGNQSTPFGAPVVGSVLSAVGTDVLTLATSTTSALQVSWTVTGAGASFTGVYATLVSKLTSPKVEGLGTAGTPEGGVISIQGVPGGEPLPISGTVMATNPSVDADGGPAPAFSTQVGGSDGTNLQALRVHDLDSGAGEEFDLGVSIRLPGSGGSVAGGTATDPLRVDPTGTTPQPITAAALPLPAGAATEATLATRVADATITARLNTLGQKAMAASAPVVIASDQSAVPISGSDGAAQQEVRVHDLDTGAGTEFDLGVSIRLPGAGGSVAGGTSANPLRTDPTGTTTQPVSATSLPLPTGAATEATLATRVADATITARLNTLGQKAMAASAPVVIASDQSRLPVSTEVQLDYNTGAGTQSLSVVGLALPSAGGSVAGGTSTNPIRVDPTGTTNQPISATSLPLPTGAATEATLATRVADATVTARLNTLGQKVMATSAPVVIASDQSSIPVSSTQLPAALVSGRLDTNVGSWLGSTSPTVGQKLMAQSVPVVIAGDQSAVPISGTVTATNPSVSTNNAAAPGSSTQVGGTDGTNLRPARVYDLDTGVGNVYDLGVSLRLPASGGSVAGGTGTNPLRVDPTGTTTQPISAASLPLPTGAASELTLSTRVADSTITSRLGLLGQKPMTGSAPVVIASDQSAIPITGSVTATNPSVGAVNSSLPASATQIGASDGINLRVPRVYDLDTAGGLEWAVGTILRASGSGGSVETGVTSHPLRIDPTGTTTQPISAVSLPLPTGAAQDRTTAGTPFSVRLSDGVGFYDTIVETQLPSALVGGRLDTNIGAWFGSTVPTVGQKVAASSIPVVIASDQSAITITGSVTATNPSVGTVGSAVPASATTIGASDGTDLRVPRVFDADSGAGTQYVLGAILRKSASGGSVEAGTSADPLRIDPTGSTTQPISATQLPAALVGGRLDTNNGAWLGSTAPTVGQKTSANSIPVVIASDQSAVTVSGTVAVSGTVTVAGTVTANIGTTNGLALDATLTGGAQKAIVRGGAKGATAAADVTSTAEASDHQALDVQIYHGGSAVNPTQIRALTASDVVSVEINDWLGSTAPTVGQKTSANSLPVVIASDQSAVTVADGGGSLTVDTTQLPAALVGGRLDTNNGAWLGSTAPTVGQKTSANSLPVVIASDQSAVTVTGTVTATNPSVGTNNAAAPASSTQIGGTDGTNLQAARVFDADTGAGSQYVLGTILRKSASGGSVEAGTSTDPLRIDPTGTTTQPVSDAGGSLTVDTTQLPAALVGGRLDTNVGAWLGSTAPTVGQKAMAASLPVVIASDQSTLTIEGEGVAGTPAGGVLTIQGDPAGEPIPITGSISATNPSVGPTEDPVPTDATQIGGSDGTDLQAVRVFDLDTDPGTEYNLGISIRLPAAGGSVAGGTGTNPLRIDPTGTTAQPVTDNGGSLTVDTTQLPAALVGGRLDANVGAWLGSTAPTVGQKAMAASLPVVIASDQSAVAVSGTVTANIGTTNGLALDATLTGGTAKAIVRGGAKGATAAADVTSTAEGADHQALDVQIYHGGAAINPTQIRALTATDVVSVEVNDWLGSTAPTVGQKTSANSIPTVLASDQSAIPVTDNGGSITVDGTVTVTQATAANLNAQVQGTAAAGAAPSGNPVQVGGSDGSAMRAIKVLSDGTVVTRYKELATFTALSTATVIGNNKSMLSILNAGGSTVVVRLLSIYVVNTQTTSVTGVAGTFELRRITGHSVGTQITAIEEMDTADTLDASVTVRTGATIAGESATLLWRSLFSTDEWGPGTLDVEGMDHAFQTMFPIWVRQGPDAKPILLRAGEGLTVKFATNSTAGTFDILLVFTQE